jgi:mannan polymerase II complex MNN10 subunit
MLFTRSLKVSPSLLLIVCLLVFLGLRYGQVPLSPQQRLPATKHPRIALVTFVTEERSYLHLALKSKNREFSACSVW